jgi:hypothetical protein
VNDDEAIKVHIVNTDDIRVQRTEEKEPEHFVFSTYVVASALAGYNTIEQVLAEDPLRKDASILAVDSPIVVCHSPAQANSPANQVAGVPYPQGAYLPANQSITIAGTGRVFVVATVNTASRVSVAINRRQG